MDEWQDKQYYWVVICKNHKFHNHDNVWFGHKILLGETDSFSSLPIGDPQIMVRCDACGKEHQYRRDDILKYEAEPVEAFIAHPLFR